GGDPRAGLARRPRARALRRRAPQRSVPEGVRPGRPIQGPQQRIPMSPAIAAPKAASRRSSAAPHRPPAPKAILEPRVARLLANLRKVQKDPSDEEAIHDVRVAARRLLVAGDLWAPLASRWERVRSRLGKL